MELDREYLRDHSRIVLLVCDYYEMLSAAKKRLVIDQNLALASIMGVPIIRLILRNLVKQSFRNVVILGRDIEAIVEEIQASQYDRLFNLRVFKTKSNALGGVFREMYELGFEYSDFIVHYADYYTSISLQKLLDVHRKTFMNIITMYSNPWISPRHLGSNDKCSVLYYNSGAKKIFSASILSQDFVDYIKKTKLIRRGPLVAALSGRVLQVFAENSSLNSLDDVLFSLVTIKREGCNFTIFSDTDFDVLQGEHNCSPAYHAAYDRCNIVIPNISASPTVLGYLIPAEQEAIPEGAPSVNVGAVQEQESSTEQSEETSSESKGSGVSSYENSSGYDSETSQNSTSYFSTDSSTEEEEESIRPRFLVEAANFLCDIVTKRKVSRKNRRALKNEFFMMCSIWDASIGDILDAFVDVFFFFLDLNDMEASIFRITPTLSLLSKIIEDRRCQEMLMELLYTHSLKLDFGIRKRVFMGYGFLLVEERIVDREVLREYCENYESMSF